MDLSSYVNLVMITVDVGLLHVRDLSRNSLVTQCSRLFEEAIELSVFSEITN
jgi:hypothetical protein